MMNHPSRHADCGGCTACPPSIEEVRGDEAPYYEGWKLIGMAAWYFLIPAMAALAGAALGGSGMWQFLGAFAGLCAGLAFTTGLARLLSGHGKDTAE